MSLKDKELYESLRNGMWNLETSVISKRSGKPMTVDPNIKPN